jgi:hypothetical protein
MITLKFKNVTDSALRSGGVGGGTPDGSKIAVIGWA